MHDREQSVQITLSKHIYAVLASTHQLGESISHLSIASTSIIFEEFGSRVIGEVVAEHLGWEQARTRRTSEISCR